MTRRSWWLLALVIAALAFAASVNSVANGFAYDDVYLLVKNARRMHSLAGVWRDHRTVIDQGMADRVAWLAAGDLVAVRLYGMDASDSSASARPSIKAVAEYLDKVDPAYAEAVRGLQPP